MTSGYRVFVFTAEKLTRLPKKAFNEFYLQNKPALKGYAGQAISIALVMYSLKNRRPYQITSIDTARIVVDADGMLDADFSQREIRYIADKLDTPRSSPVSTVAGRGMAENVIDAGLRFDQRAWDTFNPKLPGPIHKQILEALFP